MTAWNEDQEVSYRGSVGLAWPNCSLRRNRRYISLVIVITSYAITGCSGLVSDSLTGDLLPEQSILPPESNSKNPLGVPRAGDDELGSKSQPSAEELHDEPVPQQDDKPQGFRFSNNLPEEPSFELTREPSEQRTDATATPGSKNDIAKDTVTLIARVEPPHVKHDFDSASTRAPIAASTKKAITPLKPIPSDSSSPKGKMQALLKSSVGLPPLSHYDLKQVTDSVVEVPSMAINETVDLSSLELDVTLSATPNANSRTLKVKEMKVDEKQSMTASEHLAETILLIKKSTDFKDIAAAESGAVVAVRLLEALQQKIDKVSDSGWSLSDDEKHYWHQQLNAITVMLETKPASTGEHSDQLRQAATQQALNHLRDAAGHLQAVVGLRVRGGQLCSEINGFGQYRELASNRFYVGDRALVYIEVENYLSLPIQASASESEQDSTLWQTRLETSYTIYNSDNQVVQQETYPIIEDRARHQRNDFYLHLPLTIPELPAGDYELKIEVEDLARTDSATLSGIRFLVK